MITVEFAREFVDRGFEFEFVVKGRYIMFYCDNNQVEVDVYADDYYNSESTNYICSLDQFESLFISELDMTLKEILDSIELENIGFFWDELEEEIAKNASKNSQLA